MTPIVHTTFSEVICVVQMDPHWELYIEAKDGLYEHKDKAPGLIVDLMRSLTKQYGLRPSKGTKT